MWGFYCHCSFCNPDVMTSAHIFHALILTISTNCLTLKCKSTSQEQRARTTYGAVSLCRAASAFKYLCRVVSAPQSWNCLSISAIFKRAENSPYQVIYLSALKAIQFLCLNDFEPSSSSQLQPRPFFSNVLSNHSHLLLSLHH